MSNKTPDVFQKGWKPPIQQQSEAPGSHRALDPKPVVDTTADGKPYKAAGKLDGKKAIITGGDSGIGRATALLFGRPVISFRLIDIKSSISLGGR